jgi:hypothetical protein
MRLPQVEREDQMNAGMQSGRQGAGRIWVRCAGAFAGLVLLGAVYLAVTRADALILDLGRFVGCL